MICEIVWGEMFALLAMGLLVWLIAKYEREALAQHPITVLSNEGCITHSWRR